MSLKKMAPVPYVPHRQSSMVWNAFWNSKIPPTLKDYHQGKIFKRDKFDVDKFGSPISYQIFLSILRMRCVKMGAPRLGCRRGGFSAHCMQCECAT